MSWLHLPFDRVAVAQSDKGRRIKQRDYSAAGAIPVIDQGQEAVGGYTDDAALAFDGELPVILFGDHTRSVKLVSQRFAVGADGIKIFRPADGVRPKYLYYWMKSAPIPDRGYGRHYQYLRKLIVPVPAPPLQDNIVAEIEKQFSRLDEAVVGLQRVKANLKRYKAAILKAAVEGRLVETEADLARREGRSYETGAQLLQRILATRRQQWQGKGKYKEPAAADTTDLPELRDGWEIASLDQLTCRITSGSRDWAPYYNCGSSIFVLAQNVRPLVPDFSAIQLVDPPENDPSRNRSRIEIEDLLVTIVGANTGQVCMISSLPGEAYVCQSVALVRPAKRELSAFINYWLNSAEHGQKYFERCFYGQGRPHLSFEQLAVTPIALPPLPEQHRIVAEVDRLLSIAREAETEVDANLKRAQALRQAILTRAFQPVAPSSVPAYA